MPFDVKKLIKNNGATKEKSETSFFRSIYVDQIPQKKVQLFM